MKQAILSLWIGFAAVCAAAASAQAQSSPADAIVFQKRCARCHEAAGLQRYLARRPDDATRAADLDAFLAKHHAPDEDERQAIIRWLLTR
jgi:hypothetical protein